MDTHRKQRSPIIEELSALEPIFHRPELGTTRADFERMTHPHFWEIGASGQIYERKQILNILSIRDQPEQDVWETDHFASQQLGPDLYLINYVLLQNHTRITQRTTLWLRTPEGWRAMFHQGTLIQETPPALPPQTSTEMERLAQAWIDLYAVEQGSPEHAASFWAYIFADDLRREDPDMYWQFILAVLRLNQSIQVIQNLSAGPIEDLLAKHGPQFIERVEDEARRNPIFAFTLCGVWQNQMTDEVWDRLQAVANDEGWTPDESPDNDPDTLEP